MNELRKMMVERQKLIDIREDVWDKAYKAAGGNNSSGMGPIDAADAAIENMPEIKRIEELYEKIRDYIDQNYKTLSVEDVIEGLTSIGGAPSILYDDNGHFAIGGDGTQPCMDIESLPDGADADFGGTWFLKKEDWKKTIREAIDRYFERDQEE